uniref:Uncharacterized protein n=1 Tax=Romanomermis culicivorax TaxID=13658 RepID=A0A915JHB2_ROMCU
MFPVSDRDICALIHHVHEFHVTVKGVSICSLAVARLALLQKIECHYTHIHDSFDIRSPNVEQITEN